MSATIRLQTADLIVFFIYFVGIVGLGLRMALKEKRTSRDYFLASDRLPWYAIGGSVLAANISSEHFIGMIGWAYTYGFVIANFEWGAWMTWSIALWFFLPFYLRTRICTMPEFMERRYNKACRYLLSLTSIVTYVTALEGAVLYAGAKALQVMFGLPLPWGVILLGMVAGLYTIAGGLLSVVWVEFVQSLVFLLGGGLVAVLGVIKVGGLGTLMAAAPDKFHMYYLVHDKCPILAYYLCGFFVGAYYISSNQFMIQRCLGGRTHWDGRMGLLFSNYLKLLMPFIVVLPGIVAFHLFPVLKDPDQAYPLLVGRLLGPGLFGLMMAALAAAIMSTVSSALNSASTLVTLDIYKPLVFKNASEKHLVRAGRVFSALLLVVGIVLGIFYTFLQDSRTGQPMPVFSLIMNIFFFIGPPLSIVFLAGIFWSRATPAAAICTIVGGYLCALLSQYLFFTSARDLPVFLQHGLAAYPTLAELKQHIDNSFMVRNFNNFLYVALWNGLVSLAIMLTVSLWTRPRPRSEIESLLWRPSVMRVDSTVPDQGRGTRSLVFWWILCMVLTAGLYGYFAWFQWRH